MYGRPGRNHPLPPRVPGRRTGRARRPRRRGRPPAGRWAARATDKRTVFQTTLHAGRYVIEVGDYHAMRAVRAATPDPIDNLVVVVNEAGYGGGARAAVDMPAAAYHAHKLDTPIPYEDALRE